MGGPSVDIKPCLAKPFAQAAWRLLEAARTHNNMILSFMRLVLERSRHYTKSWRARVWYRRRDLPWYPPGSGFQGAKGYGARDSFVHGLRGQNEQNNE